MAKKDRNITSKERSLVNAVLGGQKPKTKKAKELAQQIQEIRHKGRVVDIPNELL